ncbi:MAG: hypothetical protein RL670_1149 [Actinomycetota bacterium]|jgi:hypothetical protein
MTVFEWLKNLRRKAQTLALPNREERGGRNRDTLDLAPFTPDSQSFLGQLAYHQLSTFEILTNELKYSPNTTYQAQLSAAASKHFLRYKALAKHLELHNIEPAEAMDPFVERIETFNSRLTGIDWYESLLKVYLTQGLLDDFYRRLAVGLDAKLRVEVEKVLADRSFEKFVVKILTEATDADPQLKSRLALWGRRLMGDALLEMRASLDDRRLAGVAKNRHLSAAEARDVRLKAYATLEPLTTELNATHSSRMDALGLTA